MDRERQTRKRDELYRAAARDFGTALDRLAAGYEADPDKRHDLRQEIHFQLWRSFASFDERCSLRTWLFRVAHNVAASYIGREQRTNSRLVTLEEAEQLPASSGYGADSLDRDRAIAQISQLIFKLKPPDRQIMISYLEGMDAATIAEITGFSTSNVAMKIHRLKNVIAKRFHEVNHHA